MYWFAYPVFYTMFVTVVTLREISYSERHEMFGVDGQLLL